MQILPHPDYSDDESKRGPIRNFLNEIKRKDPKLFALVKQVFDDIKVVGLAKYETIGYIERLGHVKEPIFELRIPPGKRAQGVARFYFCKSKENAL